MGGYALYSSTDPYGCALENLCLNSTNILDHLGELALLGSLI